jgi:hypothetical protein
VLRCAQDMQIPVIRRMAHNFNRHLRYFELSDERPARRINIAGVNGGGRALWLR